MPGVGLREAEDAAVVALTLEAAQGGFERLVRTNLDFDRHTGEDFGAPSRPGRGRGATTTPPGGNSIATCHDIRTYYEEAALELATETVPGARAAEAWFFERTEAGKTVLATRAAMKDQGAPFPVWFYMAPGHR